MAAFTFTQPDLGQEDMNRDFSVSYASIVKYMQAARMRLPWIGHGYRAFETHEPPMQRRLLMRSQFVHIPNPSTLHGSTMTSADFTASCFLAKVGNTSLELCYELSSGEH